MLSDSGCRCALTTSGSVPTAGCVAATGGGRRCFTPDAACTVTTTTGGNKFDTCNNAAYLTATIDPPAVQLEADQNLAAYEFYSGQLLTVRWTSTPSLTSVTGTGAVPDTVKMTYTARGTFPLQTPMVHWLTNIGSGRNCGNGLGGNIACAYANRDNAVMPAAVPVTAGVYSVFLGEQLTWNAGGTSGCGPCVVGTNINLLVTTSTSPFINITAATPFTVLRSRIAGVLIYSDSTLISGVTSPVVSPFVGSNITINAKLIGSARVGTAEVRLSSSTGGNQQRVTYLVPIRGLAAGANFTTNVLIPANWPPGTTYFVDFDVVDTASGQDIGRITSATFAVAAAPSATSSNSRTGTPSTTPSFTSTPSMSQTPTPTATSSKPIDLNALLAKASANASSDSLVTIIGVVVGVVVIGIGVVMSIRLFQRKKMVQRKRMMATKGTTKEAHMLYLGGPSSAPAPMAKASAGMLRQADSFKSPAARTAPEAASKGGKSKAAFAPEEVAAPTSVGKKVKRDPSQRGPAW